MNIHNPIETKWMLDFAEMIIEIRLLTGRSENQAIRQLQRVAMISLRSTYSVSTIHKEWKRRYYAGWKYHRREPKF